MKKLGNWQTICIIILATVCAVFIILAVIFSCNKKETSTYEPIQNSFSTVSVKRDNRKNVIQEVLFNTENNQTYIFDYFWEKQTYDGGTEYCACVKTTITIIDKYGNIIKNSAEE